MSFPAVSAAPAAGRVERWIPPLALLYGLLVVYGSLLPFSVLPLSPAEAWARFVDIPMLSAGAGGRADWVANILLFVPLAFLWCARAEPGRAPRLASALLVLVTCALFAVALEFVQVWFAPRTVSQNDILAEWIGSAVGVLVWLLWGRRLISASTDIAGGGAAGLGAALAIYCGAYAVFVLMPFDFVISRAELAARLDRGGIAPLLSPWCGGTLRCSINLSVETASLVPIGFLIALMARRRGRPIPGMLSGAAIGALIGITIEGGQLLLVSGMTQGASVITRAAGVAGGVLLGRWWTPGWVAIWVRFGRPLLVPAAAAYGLLVAALFWRGGWELDQALARLQALSWLPFYYHYYTSEQGALVSLLSNAALYAPIGAGFWLWRFAGSGGGSVRLPGTAAAATTAALLAVALEASRLMKVSPHPDPTNILIAAVAAACAFRATGWLAACLLAEEAPARPSFRR